MHSAAPSSADCPSSPKLPGSPFFSLLSTKQMTLGSLFSSSCTTKNALDWCNICFVQRYAVVFTDSESDESDDDESYGSSRSRSRLSRRATRSSISFSRSKLIGSDGLWHVFSMASGSLLSLDMYSRVPIVTLAFGTNQEIGLLILGSAALTRSPAQKSTASEQKDNATTSVNGAKQRHFPLHLRHTLRPIPLPDTTDSW